MAVKLDILLNFVLKNSIQKMERELKASMKSMGRNFNFDNFFSTSKGSKSFDTMLERSLKRFDRYFTVVSKKVDSFAQKKYPSFKKFVMTTMGIDLDNLPEEVSEEDVINVLKKNLTEKAFANKEKELHQRRVEAGKKGAKAKEDFEKYRKESEEESSRADWERLQEQIKKEQDLAKKQELLYKYDLKMKLLEAKAWKEHDIIQRREEEEKAMAMASEEKRNIKMNRLHAKALDENKKRDEALRKKQWMLMLGKWGKLGVWGLVAQQAIKYISKAVGYVYSTSMQGLDWERTIRGGAAGGSWFGQGLAAYQRAGIGANQYQSFKRGIQGYLGSVKLGMGNAAPLMYLGLSALGDPDELERQLERSLRRLPKDVSLALAGQMGLDYNMWEAIYSGRIDRQRSAYSEEAIKSWARLADSLNVLITNLNTFFFNNLAPIADFVSRFLDKTVNRQTDWQRGASLAQWWIDPVGAIGRNLGQMVSFGAVEVIVKNENGDVISKATSYAETGKQYNWGK